MLEALLKRIRANDRTLTQIDLSWNLIGDQATQALAETLKQNQTVTQIDLGGDNWRSNNIGAEGAQALAEALKQNQTVTQIDLKSNKIGAQGAQALAEALKSNQTLTQIDLGNNGIDDANQQAINEALKTNKDRIKTTRNQTLLTLLILLRHVYSPQRSLPLEIWELIIDLFDFPSEKKGYRNSCAVASFLKQEAVFTELNQRLQSGENFRLVETHGTKIGESQFSFLAPRAIRSQAAVIPSENSELPPAKRPKYS